MKHGIKCNEVRWAIFASLKANDGQRMARLLKIDWREKGLVDIRAVGYGSLLKISLDSQKELFISFGLAIGRVNKHFYGAIKLSTEEESLSL
jgi:hypothetical protein